MKVPFLDLSAQVRPLSNAIKAAVGEVIDSTAYVMGPKLAEFEAAVADYCGARFAVGVSSGTDALLMALMALEVGQGDLVLTTPYSFFATAGVIVRAGAVPVFVDIDPGTYNLSAERLAQWFEVNPERRGRVKAILPVHLYGQCADMDRVLAVADRYGIPVIEDAAQAIGATYPGRAGKKKAGTMGTVGCFSFYPTKNLGGMGDSGLVCTDDGALAERLRLLRVHGQERRYYYARIGGNFRMDPMQAVILSVKLPYLEGWHAARRAHAAYYDGRLARLGLTPPAVAWRREDHIYNQYVVSVPARRDALKAFLAEHGVGSDVYYPVPFHVQECFRALGYHPGDFPASEYAAEHSLALPIYPELTPAMQDYVIERIGAFLRTT